MFRNNNFIGGKTQLGGERKKEKRIGIGEPDYEEVGPQRNKVDKPDHDCVHYCELCGSAEAAVRCEKCNSQAFCFSCDDMYHRHPKRSTHSRKALDSIVKEDKTIRPPLPPKDGQMASPPQPPPRRHKRATFLSSGSNNKKELRKSISLDQSFPSKTQEANDDTGKTLMGSLRRFMGNRPLPLPPPPDPRNGDYKENFAQASSAGGLTRSKTAPVALSESDLFNQSLAVAIPQSIMELNRKGVVKSPASMPPTPSSAHSQYPPLQPKSQLPSRDRKLSLQQFPPGFDDKRASMMEVPPVSQPWERQPRGGMGVAKGRSQSISNEQWSQLIEMRGGNASVGGHCGNASNTNLGTIPPHHPGFMSTMGHGRNGIPGGRGMVSSTSVCDLNTLAQQQRSYPNMPSANSFQQLSLMNYDGGNNVMWVPSCTLCQPPAMYPPSIGSGGMKRTTSNISMNLSSVGSDMTGYPWAAPAHVHHMPPMYPGYYPPGYHQHAMPHMPLQGSAMSIPDSTRSFNRMPQSPVTSVRSNSRRSHKASKARSYCGTDSGGRKSRNCSRRRSEESDNSGSSSFSEDEQVQIPSSRPPVKTGLAWQCDHCTFINPGHVQNCGMCSKMPPGKENEAFSRRGSDRRKNGGRRDRKSAPEENISDYENDKGTARKRNGRESRVDHRQKNLSALKGSGRTRNKSRQRDSLSRSPSLSGSNEDEGAQLERHLQDLRIAPRSRTGDYERLSMTSRAKEQGSLKREGGSRYKNRRRFNSERSRTPARSSPERASRRTSIYSEENVSLSSEYVAAVAPGQKSSHEGTLVGTGTASESRTIKAAKSNEKIYSKYLGKTAEPSDSNSGSESPEEIEEDDIDVFEQKSDSPEIPQDEDEKKVIDKEESKKLEGVLPDITALRILKADIEEPPSFANTLDGIETLKTNEVADIDPNSQAIDDRPSSPEVCLPDLDDIIPEFNYIPPEDYYYSPQVKGANEVPKIQKEQDHEKEIVVENVDNTNFNKDDKPAADKAIPSTAIKPLKIEEPSYEIVEGPPIERTRDLKIEPATISRRKEEHKNDLYPSVPFQKDKIHQNVTSIEPSQQMATLSIEPSQQKATPSIEPSQQKATLSREVDTYHRDAELVSSSSESLNDIPTGQRFTPLSFSSSEALFYSPPDSPDLTLSERQRRRINQAGEDDLVTALETINSSERDLKSSRETIRSSVEQLPYSDENYEDASGSRGHSIEKSSSVTLAHIPEEGSAGFPHPKFKEIIALPQEPRQLKRSVSEQILSVTQPQQIKKKKEAIMKPLSKGRSNRPPSVVMTEDEDEVDEKSLTVMELIARRKQKVMKKQGLELVQLLRDAEDYGYAPEEVSAAISLSGDKGPIEWLEDNWGHMVNTVKALASNYGQDKNVNDIGKITLAEARKALRSHKGNIWEAVTECVEERRKKFSDIYSRGNFRREEIIKALEAHDGDAEVALVELNKTRQFGSSFFKKIWAPAEEAMNSVSTLFRRDSKAKVVTTAEIKQLSDDAYLQPEENSLEKDSEYANVESAQPTDGNETVGGIYANVVTPLLRRIEETLHKTNTKAPALSEDLKRKIVKAIIEGDPEAANAGFNFDSDEESTIEELLAVAENPTFYEYFTAVDLDDDYEDNSAADEESEDDDDEVEESANESSFNETQDSLSDQEDEDAAVEVTSEFEFKEEENVSSGIPKNQVAEQRGASVFQSTKKEDVVVQPKQSSESDTYPSASKNIQKEIKKPEFSETSPPRKVTEFPEKVKLTSTNKGTSLSDTKSNAQQLPLLRGPRDLVEVDRKKEFKKEPPAVVVDGNKEFKKEPPVVEVDRSKVFKKEPPAVVVDGNKEFKKEPPAVEVDRKKEVKKESPATEVSEKTVVKQLKPSRDSEKSKKDLVKRKQNKSTTAESSKTKPEKNIHPSEVTKRKEFEQKAELRPKINDDYKENDDQQTPVTDDDYEDGSVKHFKEEDPESGTEDESMSITTGRLSLSVTQTGDKKANIDVKSQTIKTDIVSVPHVPDEYDATNVMKSTADSTLSESEFSEVEPQENRNNLAESSNDAEQGNPSVEMLDTEEAAKVRAHGGPVTVQKATFIVGQAIAKAMARESTVRRDSYSSDGSSQVGSPTPPASTPEPEEAPEDIQLVENSESDDELLRSLDTIPEEEEASERTASGRLRTRSAKTDSGSQKVSTSSKSLSIPPAVASFSGPIFIPSNVPATTAAADKNAASHSYYNVPDKPFQDTVGGTKDEGVKTPAASADYESLSQNNPESPGKSKASFSSTTESSTSKPSSDGGPLTTEEQKGSPVNETDSKVDPNSSNKTSIKSTANNKPESSLQSQQSSTDGTKENLSPKTKSSSEALPKKATSKYSETQPKKAQANQRAEEPPTVAVAKTPSKLVNTAGSEVKFLKERLLIKAQGAAPVVNSTTSPLNSLGKRPPLSQSPKRLQTKRRSTIDSSGESEDEEELAAAALRMNLINKQISSPQALKLKAEDDDSKETLRRNADYAETKINRTDEVSGNDVKNPDSDVIEASQNIQIPSLVVIQTPSDDEEEEEEEQEEEDKSITITDYEKDHEYEQLRFDRTVRRLLAEGQATSYEKAELAAQLLTFSFDETDSIQAAEGCSSLYSALQFLQQDCELCATKYPMGRMVSMLHCVHRCCYDCANNYFSFQIKTKNIRELRCPFCNQPDLDKCEETAGEYLNNMDILLKNIVDEETHNLFQRKLRDWTLMKDPNFKWCNKCSSGFIANHRARKLICPDCKDVTCALCRSQWELQHEGISCEEYAKWKEENDPEHQAEGVDKHLAECGITCPNCKFTYALAKGGCMHFTCTECKYEFCSGCDKPFKQGAKCTVGPYCEKLGLHAHHPRNCLFYLRDKEPGQLQQLLKENNVYFVVETPAEVVARNGRHVCNVLEQKETAEGLKDEICGRATLEDNAGLCRQHYIEYLCELVHDYGIDPIEHLDEEDLRLHYIEYLVELINNNGLDPVSIFDEADLRVCLRRNGKSVPVRRWESEKLYRDKLIKLIKEQLPLC